MLHLGSCPCRCTAAAHETRLVAVTGGPGGGKTAILELARRSLCKHVAVLPEAATIVFGGGFPRHATLDGRRAAQRAIFHVQREVERLVIGEASVGLALCDRGTLDGLAYWPGDRSLLWDDVHTNLEAELSRYAAVIHLETPDGDHGYNHQNPLRIESPDEARAIDARIADIWSAHPNRFTVSSSDEFFEKATAAMAIIRSFVPPCCQGGRDDNPT